MRCLLPGVAVGELLKLTEPLSFWGGVDPTTGAIVDRNHPQYGVSITGVILVMAHGRGSSSSATVLAEMIRIGTAPLGLILQEPDQILVTAGFVANYLYSSEFVVSCGQLPPGDDGVFRLDEAGLNLESAGVRSDTDGGY